jgi:hypothetical protein
MTRMLAVIAVSVSLAGCGGTERVPAPKEVAGPAQRAARVVERLERAVRRHDFATVCDDLLTAAARSRAGGDACATTMADSSKGVRRARIRILSIDLIGRRAAIRVRSRAAGQRPVDETLELERAGRGYRIASLNG